MNSANTRGATAWCLEIHDLVTSKLIAGRDKDLEFALVTARHGLVDEEVLRKRLSGTRISAELRAAVEGRIRRLFAQPREPGR